MDVEKGLDSRLQTLKILWLAYSSLHANIPATLLPSILEALFRRRKLEKDIILNTTAKEDQTRILSALLPPSLGVLFRRRKLEKDTIDQISGGEGYLDPNLKHFVWFE